MLEIETKVDSAEKLAAVAGKPTENHLFAGEVNSMVAKINEIENIALPDAILIVGTEDKVGNTYTYENYTWRIGTVLFNNTDTPIEITIASATAGFRRKDISVFDTNNNLVKIEGVETDGEVVTAPDVPPNTILYKEYDVDGETITEESPAIIGNLFKRKLENIRYKTNQSGAEVIIDFRPEGHSHYSAINSSLTSVAGFSLDLIDPLSPLYEGQDIIFENLTGNPIGLKNMFVGVAVPFKLTIDLVVPNEGKIWFRFRQNKLEFIMKSWNSNYDLGDWLVNRFVHNNAIQPYLLGSVVNGGNINTGTSANVNSFKTMTGVGFNSGVSAGGGYRFISPYASIASIKGLCAYGSFYLGQSTRDNVIQFGFRGGLNAVYLLINTDTAVLFTRNDGAVGDPSETSASYVLTAGTHYTFLVEFVSLSEIRTRIKETLTNVTVFDVSNTIVPASNQRFTAVAEAIITTAGSNNNIIGLNEFSYGMKPEFLNDF